jgi:integrase
MARRGQVGHIEKSGKWYVVRFWEYPPDGQRILRKVKICPISGQGYMPSGERRRRALEIVEQSGVNDAQTFNETNLSPTFKEQAKWFLDHAPKRKRNPVKPATLRSWENCVEKWLNPHLGDLPLAQVGNGTVKTLVAKMAEDDLAPKTISTYVGLVKLIVASAVDSNGEQLFPRQWNHEFLDLPVIGEQRRPMFDAETVGAIVKTAAGQHRMLLALLAGTGLRIGEALGLELRHVSKDCRTITIEQSVWDGEIQTPKTKNAYRQVDIAPALADLLKAYVSGRGPGLLFTNGAGKALLQANLLHRTLYPILDGLKQPHAGFHAFRRFRVTHLRKQRVPEDLIRLWIGQAAQSVTDLYSRVADDLPFRLSVVENVGVGFDLPDSLIPVIPSAGEANAEASEPQEVDVAGD